MSATIIDVAREAGVSKTTVSRYLNDRGRVRGETARRIERVIRELNYIPNAAARNLALGRTDRLGVLVSGVNSPFWNRVLEAVHASVSELSEPYEIFTLNCDSIILNNTCKSLRDKIQVLAEQRVAGILLALWDVPQADIDYLCEQDIPFAVIQSNRTDERVSYVNIDNYRASCEAAQYVMRLGHRAIAYVSGPTEAIYANERFEGFRDALMAKKLYRRSLILNGDNSYQDGYWRMRQILSWDPMPTAAMFGSDAMAYGAVAAVREAGLRVPEDISVVGFDGMQEEVAIYGLLPPLTTVCQPMRLIGEKAAEILLKQIRSHMAGKSRAFRVTLPTRFLDRGSCRAV